MNLQHLRVLVTRPKPHGEMLCEKIREAGGNPIYLPTLEIIPFQDKLAFERQIQTLDQFDWVFFISPQAVIQSAAAIHQSWPHFPVQLKVAAVGAGTAMTLQEAKLPVSLYPELDWRTEGLIALPELQNLQGKKIAIICGLGGRELLADVLMERGALVTRMIAYQRVLPEIDMKQYIHLFHSHSIDIIVSTSNESLRNLLTMVGKDNWPDLYSIPLLVVSERIAVYAKELGFEKVMLAENASHTGIVECLFKQKGIAYGK